jgi:hypothetical protein
MALQRVQIGSRSYDTERGETTTELGGKRAGRAWEISVVVDTLAAEDAVAALYDGNAVSLTLQDGTIVEEVTVEAGELPVRNKPYVVRLRLEELV